jgi:hypothetical protein
MIMWLSPTQTNPDLVNPWRAVPRFQVACQLQGILRCSIVCTRKHMNMTCVWLLSIYNSKAKYILYRYTFYILLDVYKYMYICTYMMRPCFAISVWLFSVPTELKLWLRSPKQAAGFGPYAACRRHTLNGRPHMTWILMMIYWILWSAASQTTSHLQTNGGFGMWINAIWLQQAIKIPLSKAGQLTPGFEKRSSLDILGRAGWPKT